MSMISKSVHMKTSGNCTRKRNILTCFLTCLRFRFAQLFFNMTFVLSYCSVVHIFSVNGFVDGFVTVEPVEGSRSLNMFLWTRFYFRSLKINTQDEKHLINENPALDLLIRPLLDRFIFVERSQVLCVIHNRWFNNRGAICFALILHLRIRNMKV